MRNLLKIDRSVFIHVLGLVSLSIIFVSLIGPNISARAYSFKSYETTPEFKFNKGNVNKNIILDKRYDLEVKNKRLQEFLIRKNGVFKNSILSRIIIDESDKVGADYRIVAGIMGKESGFCNAAYKIYNCFGWLNGVQYNSFPQAFHMIVPGVSRYAAGAYLNELSLINLGMRYGAVNYKNWGQNVYRFALKI